MATKTWQPNEKQKLFLDTIAKADGKTLRELSQLAGTEFSTGATNTLKTKGFTWTEEVKIPCNIVRQDNGEVIGTCNKVVSIYHLVKADGNK